MKDKFEFSGKLALIVGGSSGIGKAVAEALLKSQAQVIIVGRKIDKLNKTAQELADYGNVEVLQADLTNKQDVACAVQQCWTPAARRIQFRFNHRHRQSERGLIVGE